MKKVLYAAALLATQAFAGQEVVSPTTLTIDLGAAAISGAGRQVRVNNAPVYNGGTVPTYYNANFELQFLPDGRLAAVVSDASIAAGPASTPSASTLNFLPGQYKDMSSGCIWTLSDGNISPDNGRSYIMTKNVLTCAEPISFQAPTFYAWSTLPPLQNPNVNYSASTTLKTSYPAGLAWGTTSQGEYVRASASGTALDISSYNVFSGLATYVPSLTGSIRKAFVKQ